MLSCIVPSQPIARSSKEFLHSARFLHRRTVFQDINLNVLAGVRCLHRRIGRISVPTCSRTSPLSYRETRESFLTRSAGRIHGSVLTEWTGVASTPRRGLHSSPGALNQKSFHYILISSPFLSVQPHNTVGLHARSLERGKSCCAFRYHYPSPASLHNLLLHRVLHNLHRHFLHSNFVFHSTD